MAWWDRRGGLKLPHLRTIAFVAPLLSGLLSYNYTVVVDNLVHAALGILVYGTSC